MLQASCSASLLDERTIVGLGDGLRESSDNSIVEAGDCVRNSSASNPSRFWMLNGCIAPCVELYEGKFLKISNMSMRTLSKMGFAKNSETREK